MAEGFVLDIPLDMINRLGDADEKIEKLAQTSEETSKRVITAFQQMSTQGVTAFVESLNKANQILSTFGGGPSKGMSVIVEQADRGAKAIAGMQAVYEKVFQADGAKVSNSTIAKLNAELEETQKRLGLVQSVIDRGVVNTPALQAEQAQLAARIQQLQEALAIERQIAQEKLFAAQQVDAYHTKQLNAQLTQQQQQKKINKSERATAAEKSRRAKEINQQYADSALKQSQADRVARAEKQKLYNTIFNSIFKQEEAEQKRHENELKRIEREAKERERAKKKSEKLERDRVKSSSELIPMQKSMVTLQQLNLYATELKKTLATLDPNTAEFAKLNRIYGQTKQKIDAIKVSIGDAEQNQKEFLNTSDQLRRSFSLLFSVSAIKGYINQIVKVRGEFELQQRSLQAILKNKDEANKIWAQTLQLAVRSPFQVKELVSYTKQLAAYRVESEKLHNTTKMLADVSAGLGVDMQRLILAYGQVKSANYLRGTELRQFSEAGINVLGELAKYFSELEGKAISVGEVFDRVSKRMVAFSDVEEVFKRITGEGGVFYNMQEIQAETLKGQISNLRDVIDIALNEIGLEHEDSLKGTISFIRELITNWKELAFYISKITALFLTYKGVAGLVALSNSSMAISLLGLVTRSSRATIAFDKLGVGIRSLATSIGLGTKGVRLFSSALGGIATLGVAGIIIGIAVAIMEVWRQATRAKREMKELNKEINKMFVDDTRAVDRQVKGFENLANRLKIVNKNSQEHRDIISQLNSNYGEYLGYLVDENTTYEKLSDSIGNVSFALINKAKFATYEKAYSKVLEKTNKTISESQDAIRKNFGSVTFKQGQSTIIPTEKEINDIFALYEKRVEETGEVGYSMAKKVLEEYGFSLTGVFNWAEFENYGEAILTQKREELRLQERINEEYGNYLGYTYEYANTAQMRRDMEALKRDEADALANANSRVERDKVRLEYAKKMIQLQGEYQGKDRQTVERDIKNLEKRSATILDINAKIAKSTDKLGEKYADMIYIDMNQADKSLSELATAASGTYQQQLEIIDEQNNLKRAGTKYSKTELENAQKTAMAYEFLLKLMGREDLLVKKGKDKVAEKLNNQIQLIREMNREYEKLSKTMSAEEAKSKVKNAYEPTAKTLGLDISNSDFDKKGTINMLNTLFDKFPTRLKKNIQKALDNYQVEIDIKVKEESLKTLSDNVSDAFARYDLSKSLDEMGVSREYAKKYFDFEYLDLEGLKKYVNENKQAFEENGENGVDAWKEFEKKVTEIERKAQQERLKTYLAYARSAISKRAQIKLEELRKLAEIEKTFTKPEQEKEKQLAKGAVEKESQNAAKKLEWDEFQKTDTFINLFKDLDSASSELINHAIKKLNDFKDNWKDMPLEDMRIIVGKINELQSKLAEISPFATVKKLELAGAGKNGAFATYQQEAIDVERAIRDTEQLISNYEIILSLKRDGKDADAESYAMQVNLRDAATFTVDALVEQIGLQKNAVIDKKTELNTINEKFEREKQLSKAYLKQADALDDAKKMANDLIDSFSSLAEVLGVGDDSMAMVFVEMGQSIMNSVLNTIMLQAQLNAARAAAQGLGVAMNTALGVIGWIVMAVQLVVETLKAIFNAHDKSLLNEIEAIEVAVERLENKFSELANSIDEVYSTENLKKVNDELRETNRLLIENYKAQLALQKERKQTDEVKDEIKDLQEKIAQAETELVDALADSFSHATDGIIDSAIDAATAFVDAWYDAFQETGDGLKGLEENLNGMLVNMIKRQAALTIVGQFTEKWKNQLADMYQDDSQLTNNEIKEWVENIKSVLPTISEDLEAFFEAFAPILSGTGELSGLTESISGMTEETAEILAAYLNSIRFFVAENNEVIKQLRDATISNDDNANPMLAQLKIIAQHTGAISELLSEVRMDDGKGIGLRVYMP